MLTFWRAKKVNKLSALIHVTFFILPFENIFYNTVNDRISASAQLAAPARISTPLQLFFPISAPARLAAPARISAPPLRVEGGAYFVTK